jgi:hypothetical protein
LNARDNYVLNREGYTLQNNVLYYMNYFAFVFTGWCS